jgi:3-dehydroquinate dehydratase / shikimate dehydrogenase
MVTRCGCIDAADGLPSDAAAMFVENPGAYLTGVLLFPPPGVTWPMICISINQESRRMALVDMLNAARQCDLVEVRLDRFGKAPELGELIAHKPKPVIMSCRRPADGGHWDGTEDERLALLRQCIISKADYVEIELDIADQIRPFPPAKRVICYTNLRETPADIADIYAEAQTKKPDVIKLTTLAHTPEEAWPLVQILAKATIPTVVVGLGKPGVMLTVLGKKIGCPWAYAALEKGMEAYPGQPTVSELKDVYHYQAIEKTTRLIGVTGFGEREVVAVGVLNHVLGHFGMPARCRGQRRSGAPSHAGRHGRGAERFRTAGRLGRPLAAQG